MPDDNDPTPDEHTPPDEHRRLIPGWLVPLLIGLVTITAGVVTWRAGQLASAAAFEDRQSVGQTITQQQQVSEAGLATINDSVAYVSYVADFAEAAALDDLAAEAEEQGLAEVAARLRDQADDERTAATGEAQAVGVFGDQTLLAQIVADPTEPVPFDFDQALTENEAAVSTGITSPGVLDPDGWATQADTTRKQVRSLRVAALLLLLAVVAYTVAELTPRIVTRRAMFAVGSVIYIVVSVTTFSLVF
ncbi:MAG: hypothetical protein GY812_06640 [Actinomycetia bacterium]|nr:hypothetical protein [Actinomycetes bacterium]